MNRQEYIEFHKNMCRHMVNVTEKKNADYTGNTDNPFSNLEMCERLGITNTEFGILTRMSDKLSRVISLIHGQNNKESLRESQVSDESIQDTLIDLANYCILLAGFLEKKSQSKKNNLIDSFIDRDVSQGKKESLLTLRDRYDQFINSNIPFKEVCKPLFQQESVSPTYNHYKPSEIIEYTGDDDPDPIFD